MTSLFTIAAMPSMTCLSRRECAVAKRRKQKQAEDSQRDNRITGES